jgi:hypothetical protein
VDAQVLYARAVGEGAGEVAVASVAFVEKELEGGLGNGSESESCGLGAWGMALISRMLESY